MVVVVVVGVVAIGILMFSGDDTDDLALAYAQKASFYDCRTPLKDILEYYWDGGQWYVYTADETGHMVVEYAKDKDEKTKICFDVDVDDESIKPVEYTEMRWKKTGLQNIHLIVLIGKSVKMSTKNKKISHRPNKSMSG